MINIGILGVSLDQDSDFGDGVLIKIQPDRGVGLGLKAATRSGGEVEGLRVDTKWQRVRRAGPSRAKAKFVSGTDGKVPRRRIRF